jgi:hypothetical protein
MRQRLLSFEHHREVAARDAKPGTKLGEVIDMARDNPLPKHGGDRKSQTQEAVETARDNPLSVHGAMMEQGCNTTLKRGTVTYTLRRLARDCPESTQQRIADEVGVSRQYAHEVLSSKDSQREEMLDTIPDHIEGNSSKADYRKLPHDMREAVEVSVNAYFPLSTTRNPQAAELLQSLIVVYVDNFKYETSHTLDHPPRC